MDVDRVPLLTMEVVPGARAAGFYLGMPINDATATLQDAFKEVGKVDLKYNSSVWIQLSASPQKFNVLFVGTAGIRHSS